MLKKLCFVGKLPWYVAIPGIMVTLGTFFISYCVWGFYYLGMFVLWLLNTPNQFRVEDTPSFYACGVLTTIGLTILTLVAGLVASSIYITCRKKYNVSL